MTNPQFSGSIPGSKVRSSAVNDYLATTPPSTTTSDPVIKDDSSDAKKTTAGTISNAEPILPRGILSISQSLWFDSAKKLFVSGVTA